MSIIRPLIRLRLGSVVIALLVALSAVLLPASAGAGGPQNKLEFRVYGSSPQNVAGAGAIQIHARCPVEACTVVASATSTSPSIQTGTARAHIPAGTLESISLPLSANQKAKLQAALESGRRPTFTVKATAHDSHGTHVPLTIEVKTRKP